MPEPEAIRWCPTIETEDEFLARVKQYVRDVRQWATEQGLELTLQKRNLSRDLAALAQYQIKGDDLDAVADEYFSGSENEDTARKAIASIAKLLEITLRK